jgi:hypothetical protein
MLADSGAANPTSEKRCLQCSTARSYNSTRRPTLSCALTTSLRASASLGRRYLQGTRCRIVHQSGTQILTWQGFGAGRTTNRRRMPLTDQTSRFPRHAHSVWRSVCASPSNPLPAENFHSSGICICRLCHVKMVDTAALFWV